MTSLENGDGLNSGAQPIAAPATGKPTNADKQLWVTAWRHNLANVRTYSSCMDFVDVNGDGDAKLVIGDLMKKLQVYGGTDRVSEGPLLHVPVAVCSFYADYNEEVRKPLLAVAGGPFVLFYKNLKPYYKFTLPPTPLEKTELQLWNECKVGKLAPVDLIARLREELDNGKTLGHRSMDLLGDTVFDSDVAREEYVNQVKNQPYVQHTVATCMAIIKKDREEVGGLGCPVIGTENNRLLILDRTGANVTNTITLPSTPVHLLTSGLIDVEYRIIVACRNGNVYIVKNGELLGVVLEVDSQAIGLARMDNQIVVATMSNALHYYSLKGIKQATLFMPTTITNVCSLAQESVRQSKAIVVSLSSGEVRVYVGKALLNKITVGDAVAAMKVGKYGREEGTLVMCLRSGAIIVNMIPRSASMEPSRAVSQGPPPEQDIPLKVPKRTNLYVEQTQREKDFGTEMHRAFQRELCKLRLQTARAYVKILTDGQGSQSFNTSNSLRLTANVQGLGPVFKLRLNIQNTGNKVLTGIPILFTYNMGIYKMPRPHLFLPCLVPSLVYAYDLPVECVTEEPASDVIRVYVCNPQSALPIITALVNMPLADMSVPQ